MLSYNNVRLKVGNIFCKIPVHQNIWTGFVILLAFLGFLFFVVGNILLALLLFLLSGFFDIVDGGVAAARKDENAFGKWLADFSNKGVECLFLLGLQFVAFPSLILSKEISMSLLFIFAFLFSYIKSNGLYWKILRKEEVERLPGFERAERILPLYTGLILYFYDPIFLSVFVIFSILVSTFRILENLFLVVKKQLAK
jgi:phosphatidylglycerophosphate synthase